MTDEQIDNLQAGRELDRLIAQHVFGWTDLDESEICGLEGIAPERPGIIQEIPRYSEEIQLTWKIVDLWLNRHPLVMTFRPGPKDWWVIFPDECGHPEGSKDHGKNCFREAFGATPALAICRCALKMMKEEK